MRTKPRFWHRVLFAAVCLAGVSLLAGCAGENGSGGTGSGAAEQAAETPAEPLIKTVRAEQITLRDIGDPIVAEGTVQPAEVFWVTAKQDGDVQEIVKKAGDTVAEGEIIVKLTSEELNKDRAKAAAELQAAQKRLSEARKNAAELAALNQRSLQLAQAEWNRARNDYDLGLISEAELQRAQEQLEGVRSEIEWSNKQQNAVVASYKQEVDLAQAAMKEWTNAQEALHVRSTVSGVISQIPLTPGMRVGLGSQVALIEKTDRVRISVPIPEELIMYVRGKQELLFTSGGQAHKAAVVSLADVKDSYSGSYPLILETDNTGLGLKSGMKVKVYVTDESQRHVVAVPANAILYEGGAPHVFVVQGDRVEKRKLVTGRVHDGYQEVLSGVNENEWLVVTGISSLQDQEQVRVQEQRVE